MINRFDFQSNTDNQEILPMDRLSFPFTSNFLELDTRLNKSVPWHWHPAFELDYVIEGEVFFQTKNERTLVKKGETIFLNDSSLHSVYAKDKMDGCKLYTIIFGSTFLFGTHNSLLEQKYLQPISKFGDFHACLIRPDSSVRLSMTKHMLNIVRLLEEEPFGYEFELRTELSRFWCLLLGELKEKQAILPVKIDTESERIRNMLEYIHAHYMEPLSLSDIALSANISSRECTRCFRSSIRMSPMTYLTEHRIRMAAQLLNQSDESIAVISRKCGFSSTSYFGKVFHKMVGCTPKKYRKVL